MKLAALVNGLDHPSYRYRFRAFESALRDHGWEVVARDRDHTFGTVTALSCLEHVQQFWVAVEEMRRVLRPDGLMIMSCPFYFRIHSFPNDYWRFTPEAFKFLLDRFPSKIIGWRGPKKRPLHVWAVAAGPDYPPITQEQHARFRKLIHAHARQPLSWDKRFRYRLGRLLCGRRPFSIFLEAEDFDTVLIHDR